MPWKDTAFFDSAGVFERGWFFLGGEGFLGRSFEGVLVVMGRVVG